MMRIRADRGFTLLEMMVVMLIAAMALALTTQALEQYRRAHSRALASERLGRDTRLTEAWFRASVRGLYPAVDETTPRNTLVFGRSEEAAPFKGSATTFSGVTLAPVLAGQGVPAMQSWTVEDAPGALPALRLEEEGHTLLLPFPLISALRFYYLDARGKLHEQWPPRLGTWPQLPEAIVLELRAGPADAAHDGVIVANVMGPRSPYRNPYENEPF